MILTIFQPSEWSGFCFLEMIGCALHLRDQQLLLIYNVEKENKYFKSIILSFCAKSEESESYFAHHDALLWTEQSPRGNADSLIYSWKLFFTLTQWMQWITYTQVYFVDV